MKKILFAFLLCASYLVPQTAHSQSVKYFHDRIDTTIYATTTGTDTYTGTNTDPNFNVAGYMRGLMVSTFIVNGNTGAATYRLVTRTGTLASAAIKKQNGAALVAGDIPDSTAVLLLYYGSFWRLEGIYTTATSAWSLTGNAGTTAGTNFIGTTDAVDFVIKTNNTEKARVSSAGVLSLGLASTNNGSLLFRNSTNANTLTINSGVTSASHAWTLPTTQGAASTALSNDGSGVLSWATAATLGAWTTTGNAGTNPATNFVGTTDGQDLAFRTNNVEAMRIFDGSNSLTINSTTEVTAAALKVKGRLIVSTQEVTVNDNYIAMVEVGVGNGVLFSDGTNGSTPNNQLGYIFGDGGLQIYGRNNLNATKFFFSGKASANRMELYSDNASDQLIFTSVGVLNLTSVGSQDAMNIIKNNAGTTLGATYSAYQVVNNDATANRLSIIGFTNSPATARHAFMGARFLSATAGELFLGTKTGGVEAIGMTIGQTGTITTPLIHNNSAGASGTTPLLASGTYTPTITDSANTSARTAYQCQWMRVGNVVTVSGFADVDPTTTLTITIIKITLPISSNFTAVDNCRGTSNSEAIAGQSAAMLCTTAYAASDFALMKWNATDVTNQPMSFTFTYLVQ